jgi:hypothetical protein
LKNRAGAYREARAGESPPRDTIPGPTPSRPRSKMRWIYGSGHGGGEVGAKRLAARGSCGGGGGQCREPQHGIGARDLGEREGPTAQSGRDLGERERERRHREYLRKDATS